MPIPLLRLGRCALVAAMFALLGGHWLVLQTVAWSGMIVEYSRASGFAEAVEKTFDGKHPCGLCESIAQTRTTEKKHDALVVVKKLDVVHQQALPWVAPAGMAWEREVADTASVVRREAPSVPPPRQA